MRILSLKGWDSRSIGNSPEVHGAGGRADAAGGRRLRDARAERATPGSGVPCPSEGDRGETEGIPFLNKFRCKSIICRGYVSSKGSGRFVAVSVDGASMAGSRCALAPWFDTKSQS